MEKKKLKSERKLSVTKIMVRGGSCWFVVDSKFFEVLVKEVRGKLRGIILERSRGFSSWIWFGDGSLKRLLEGIEECCREEKEGRVVKVWEDEGRKFRLERCVNGAGRFILCSVLNIEAKRFCLVFPEGKGLLGGCATLAEKLRSLGVCIVAEMKNAPMPIVGKLDKRVGSVEKCEEKAFVEVARAPVGRIGDALWLQLDGKEKRSREEQLGHCLLGRYLQVRENHLDTKHAF